MKNTVRIERVPFSVVKSLPFVMGLYQHASAHMWHIYNVPYSHENRIVSSFKVGESFINIGTFDPNGPASVMGWSKQITPALLTEVLAIGHDLGYQHLLFCVLDKHVPAFGAFDYETLEDHDVFMERCL